MAKGIYFQQIPWTQLNWKTSDACGSMRAVHQCPNSSSASLHQAFTYASTNEPCGSSYKDSAIEPIHAMTLVGSVRISEGISDHGSGMRRALA
jgi:hypothetical protein